MNTATQPLRFFLRELEEPFEFKCTPLYTEELRKEHLAWATERCAFKEGSKAHTHTVASDISQWIAFSFPLSRDLRKFKNVYYFFQMFSTMDDHADENWGDVSADSASIKSYWDKAISLMETLRDDASKNRKVPTDFPGVPSYLLDNVRYLKTILDELNSVQRNRYIDVFQTYMRNASLQSQLIGKTDTVSMEQYKEYRVKSIASMPCTLLMEYLYGIELSHEKYNHPKLHELERLGTLQVAFINDLFSLFKEYEGSLNTLNHPLTLLVLNEKMSVQEGIDEICRMIEEFQNEFIRIRDEWYTGGEPISEAVRLFVKGFEYYMAGNARWSRLSKRYHGEHFTGIITSGTLEWAAEGTRYTPVF